MLHPDSRHSKPASVKILSSPMLSASALTCCEPGTTIAWTVGATLRPLTIAAAALRSLSRELVHDPINTRSILMSSILVPGRSAM